MKIAPFERAATTKPRYLQPTGDEPLDENELAFLRALVPIIAAKIRDELIAEQNDVGERHHVPPAAKRAG